MDDQHLRSYLLGQLSEEEAESLEARLLADHDVFETLGGVEDDLLDDFARGRLDAAESARVRERYEHQPDRVRFARALSQRSARAHVVPFPRRHFLPLAAAAALAIVTSAILLRPEQEPQPLPSAAPPPPSAVLTLGTSRSAGAASEIALLPDAPALQLRVRLDPADRYDRYSMELRSAAGEVAWRVDDLKASADAGELDLLASVPSRALPGGAYELGVRGASEGGSPEDLGFVTVRITRRP